MAAAVEPGCADRAVPGTGEHIGARSDVQEPQDAEQALRVVHDRVRARTGSGSLVIWWQPILERREPQFQLVDPMQDQLEPGLVSDPPRCRLA